jgi:hypothetical protein
VLKAVEKEASARAKAARTYEAALARVAKAAEVAANKRSQAPPRASRAAQTREGHQSNNEGWQGTLRLGPGMHA